MVGGVTGRGEELGRRMASEVLPLPVGRSSMRTVSLEDDTIDHPPRDRMTMEGMTRLRRSERRLVVMWWVEAMEDRER